MKSKSGQQTIFSEKDLQIPKYVALKTPSICHPYRSNGTAKFLTKGDNNAVDDRGLYADGQQWLGMDDIVGHAVGVLPYVGFVTIVMNEWPQLKYGVLGLLALYIILHRE